MLFIAIHQGYIEKEKVTERKRKGEGGTKRNKCEVLNSRVIACFPFNCCYCAVEHGRCKFLGKLTLDLHKLQLDYYCNSLTD